jgi:hypothetical protein
MTTETDAVPETLCSLEYRTTGKKRQSYPCNRPWGPIELSDVQVPIFSRQSAHRRRFCCQTYAPAALYPPGRFPVLISVKGCRPQGHSAAQRIRSTEKKIQ